MPGLPTVDEALAAVLAHVPPPRTVRLPLDRAAGATLAQEVRADHDHPPFRRSKVDGWAVRAQDCGGAPLRIVATIPAGAPPGAAIGPGEAARILTGAAVPDGADAVAMQERCTASEGGATVAVPADAANRENVVPRGAERRAGEVVARAGDGISPARIGALASAGAAEVDVLRAPSVRIVATGDEIVPCGSVPGPGKIRNSNSPALLAAAVACGAAAQDGCARWAPDDREALAAAVSWALGADLVLLTGGVSVGDFDLVPEVLAALGVTRVLHGVKVQPGKPLWFGTRGTTLVFGLPGNPVSALVNTALFVRPAVARLTGRAAPGPFAAALGGALGKGTWRRKYVPAVVTRGAAHDAPRVATPVPFQGSGDVFGFSAANALVEVPEESPPRAAGDVVRCVPLFEALP